MAPDRLILTSEAIEARRRLRRQLLSGGKVHTDEEAARYVEERGFALLAPLKGVNLPNLSDADYREPWPGYTITDGAWRWKEILPGEKRCVYGKFLRGRGTFISWDLFPHFYALYGPADDPEEEYLAGRLGRKERLVLETVEEFGPIDSRALWKKVGFQFGGERAGFVHALDSLQTRFFLTVSGGSLEGWSLHQWDLVTRQVPEGLLDKPPSLEEARATLLHRLVDNCVSCRPAEAAGLLRWPRAITDAIAARLLDGKVLRVAEIRGWRGPHWVLPAEWP
ncbi:MAG: winged helix DNA-binding domain-containing protein [Firmicutes bacterium]|nr:winged helix DNA-binding domain-containing protein [Bacillota bacterium]